MKTTITAEQARLLSKITNTSVQDAESTLRCDEANAGDRAPLCTVPMLHLAIKQERAACRPRVAMIAVLERAIRRRERMGG